MGKKYDDLAQGRAPERRERAEAKAYTEMIEADLEAISDMPGTKLGAALAALTLDELRSIHEATQRILRGESN